MFLVQDRCWTIASSPSVGVGVAYVWTQFWRSHVESVGLNFCARVVHADLSSGTSRSFCSMVGLALALVVLPRLFAHEE